MTLAIDAVLFALLACLADHYFCFSCRSWRGDLKLGDTTARFCPCCGETRAPWRVE
jgi:hypothetical protein